MDRSLYTTEHNRRRFQSRNSETYEYEGLHEIHPLKMMWRLKIDKKIRRHRAQGINLHGESQS